MMHAFKNEVQNQDDTVKLLKEKFRLEQKFTLVKTFLNENHEKFCAVYGKGNTQQFPSIQKIGTQVQKAFSINFTKAQKEFSIFDSGSIRIP